MTVGLTPKRALFAVLLLAFLLRGLSVFDVALPYSFYPDESNNVERSVNFYDGQGGFDLNPRWFNKPALGYYINFGVFGCRYLVGRYLTGEYDSATAFANAFLNYERGSFYVLGRLLQALFGCLGVYLCYLIGAAYGGHRVGLIAAIFLAFCPGHVAFSQVVKNDALASVFVSLAFLQCLKLQARGWKSDHLWAAVWIGLGWATKYAPVALLGVLLMAHLLRQRQKGEPRVSFKLLAAALATFIAAAFVGSPYNFLDPMYWNEQLRPTLGHFSQMVFGAGEVENGAYGLLSLLGYALSMTASSECFTILPTVLAGLGLAFGLRGRDKARSVLLWSWFVFIYFMLASANTQRTRPNHLMLIYPGLAVAAAIGLDWLIGLLHRRFARPEKTLLALAMVLILLPWPGSAAAALIQRCRLLFTAPPQVVAMQWVKENIPAGTTLVNDTEVLILRPSEARYAWIKSRIEFEIEKSQRALATELERRQGMNDYDAKLSTSIIKHHRQQLRDWGQQQKRYAFEIPAAAQYLGPRYDVLVVEKPWQTEQGDNLGAFSGYNGIWERFPLPVYDRGYGRLEELQELPPVERYRQGPETLSTLNERLWAIYPLLPKRPAEFWISSEESYRNYDKESKREEFPDWAAFYDDLRQHYDALEIPADPSLYPWAIRIFDLRERRAPGTAVTRVLQAK